MIESENETQTKKRGRPLKSEIENAKTTASAFLPENVRASMINSLAETGEKEEILKELDDYQLITYVEKITKQRHLNANETKQMHLKEYAMSQGCLLKDEEFIKRLYKMNIPQVFLPIFRDADKSLDDREIWKRIRASGIKQISNDKLKEIISRVYR